jgi:N-acetylmuramic acid 6-phosphate etherase
MNLTAIRAPGETVGAGSQLLGIECGATRTVAILADARGRLCQRVEAGPANLRLLDDAALLEHFRALATRFPALGAVGIGMAGAREEQDRRRIRHAAAQAWPGIPCFAGNDLDTALAAAELSRKNTPAASVVIISGTGSCCYGRDPAGRTAKIGGWGHLLGDKGSGYEIALRALKAVVYYYDRDGRWPHLGARLLRALQLNEPNQLVDWVQAAGKADLAALAVEVFGAWRQRDKIAADILEGAAASLAKDAVACARRLAAPSQVVEFILAGSVLVRQPGFARKVSRELRRSWRSARVRLLKREGAWGAVALAGRCLASGAPSRERRATGRPTAATGGPPGTAFPTSSANALIPASTALSPTEERNPRSMRLDRLSARAAIELMLAAEAGVPAAILAERPRLERALSLIVRALRDGGRLFYVGAGTSGRLGVLDASECPPTFSVAPDMVQGLLAGGYRALFASVEGAEDDLEAGVRAVSFRRVTRKDVVVGLAASGRTPFVWGALQAAKALGAATILVCFNPYLKFAASGRPTVVICPAVGPEVLTGSTRLKAGTATKLILNLLSTLAMVRLGKVRSNLMVDLHPANTKLRERAARILRELTGLETNRARLLLEVCGWSVKRALAEAGRAGKRASPP